MLITWLKKLAPFPPPPPPPLRHRFQDHPEHGMNFKNSKKSAEILLGMNHGDVKIYRPEGDRNFLWKKTRDSLRQAVS